jgi:hypothetical protein
MRACVFAVRGGAMLTTSANGISFDSGQSCIELRRMPDGRWTIATGVSIRATGKSPWSPFMREVMATETDAVRAFLSAVPDDLTLHRRVEQWREKQATHG